MMVIKTTRYRAQTLMTGAPRLKTQSETVLRGCSATEGAACLVMGCFHHDFCERLLVPRQHSKAVPQEVQDQRKVFWVPVNEYVPLQVAHKHVRDRQ